MSVIIHSIDSASTNVRFEYLNSHHLFGLVVEATYTFDIVDLEYDEGPEILVGAEAFYALRQAYTKTQLVAKIGTDTFRAGVITSLSKGADSATGYGTASISITETQRVDDDGELSYLNQSIPSPQKVSSFSDSFSFSRSGNSINYSRGVSLKYSEDISDQFLNNAYIFLKSIYLNNRPAFGYQEDGLSELARYNVGYRPLISETYDLTDKSVTLTENFIASIAEGTFSKRATYSLENTEQGFQNKNYSVEVIGLVEPIHHTALNGLKQVIDELTTENSLEFGSPVSVSKTIGKESQRLTAEILFTTDPAQNKEDTFVYSVGRSENEGYFDYSVTVDRSSTAKDPVSAYNQLITSWGAEKDVPKDKVIALYDETSSDKLFEKSRSTTFSPQTIKVSETVVYTNNPAYDTTGDELKSTTLVKDTVPVERIHRFAVPQDKERLQRRFSGQKNTLGSRNVDVQLVYKKEVPLKEVEAAALVAIYNSPPNALTYWVTSKGTSVNPKAGTVSASLSYSYFY